MGSNLGEFPSGTGHGVLAAGTAGSNAEEVAVKIGSSVTVAAAAKLLSVCSKIGGTEVEHASIDGSGNLTIVGDLTAANFSGVVGTVASVSVTTANGVSGTVATATTTPAISLSLGDVWPTSVTTNFVKTSTIGAAQVGTQVASTHIVSPDKFSPVLSIDLTSPTTTVPSGDMASASINTTGTPVKVFALTYGGRLDQNGQDTSGTTGPVTCDRPTGIHIIANGDESVTISNTLFTAGDWVLFQFIDSHKIIDSGPWADNSVTGQIIFHAGTTQTAATRFCWEIKKMLAPA